MRIKQLLATAIFALFVMISFSTFADAECCNRKGSFGCCGNGKCNMFCCNCDNSCNKTCENTTCNDVEWTVCSGICTGCAAACASGVGSGSCIACMGISYASCQKCLASPSSARAVGSNIASCSERDEFFKSIAKSDGNDQSISLPDLQLYVQTIGKKTTATVEEIFKAYDVKKDGLIDRSEFDNSKVTHGFVN